MLTYDMSAHGDYSLYEYLYLCIRADIEQGIIAAGQKLPSKRMLAQNLGVSVITVEGAFEQLQAEGYITAVARKGYYACSLPQRKATASQHTPANAPFMLAHSLEESSNKTQSANTLVADFCNNGVAAGLFPYSSWAKDLRMVLSEESEASLLGEGGIQGSLILRQALCSYLKGSRGMNVAPEQIIVGAGAQYLYGIIVQLLGRQHSIALEDPGYPRLAKIYQAQGINSIHVRLDRDGICMQELEESGASIAHVMPSHQFPTGLVTSISRRYELLGWAAHNPARCIIEDDYDCELRLAGKPVPSLQSIDTQGQVIYTNTFTKTLGPAFRIAYMVLPPQLAQLYTTKLGFYNCPVSAVDQLALARFITSGEYERHINRMRNHYREMRDLLLDAFKQSKLAKRLEYQSLNSGIHFLIKVHSCTDDTLYKERALKHGVKIAALSDFSSAPIEQGWFVVNYAGLSEKEALAGITALEDAWDDSI